MREGNRVAGTRQTPPGPPGWRGRLLQCPPAHRTLKRDRNTKMEIGYTRTSTTEQVAGYEAQQRD